jgi:peptidoglycan/LPS O-acetylase OafA/YrhL
MPGLVFFCFNAAMRFRSDIQALRGIAVLLVIAQHAREGLVEAGYLGVDIFFVISGFLITAMLARAIEGQRFSFAEFYFRRAKRLLPAAYVTFAVTAVAAALVLGAREWQDFGRQLAGAVTFTANFVLWGQTGYFEGAAALKPLLHVWSLSVEEQYYLVAPALLVLLPRRAWLAAAVGIFTASLGAYLWLAPRDPSAAFYLLPTRAWELALGSLAALLPFGERARKVMVLLCAVAVPALLLVPVWSPALPALWKLPVVCLSTFCIIARTTESDSNSPLVGALAKVGDASYSLYLVHWPIFALLNNAYLALPGAGRPGALVQLAAAGAALALGALLYRYVEVPMRRAPLQASRKVLLPALAVSVLLATLPLAVAAASGRGKEFAALRRDNLGFGAACEGGRAYRPLAACADARAPRILVWGDSFAMAIVPGLAATSRAGVAQATKSVCAPFLGLAQVTAEYPRHYAEGCIAFNDSVLAYLQATPSVRTVVLSSPFYPYFDPHRRVLLRERGRLVEREPAQALAIAAMRDTVRRLRAAGKRVLVVAPPPSSGVDMTHCLERKAQASRLEGERIDCNIALSDYHASKAGLLVFLARLEAQAQVPVLRFDPLLCDRARCLVELDGSIVYRDEGHFSQAGSRAVARRMRLGEQVERFAR